MKIIEVKLENFKNYEEQAFQFACGSNAICGPNGSGKTTIIEAISWVLFDYLPYKNQEQIIKMTKSELNTNNIPAKIAKVQVTFISDLDKKEYIVYRNTRSQYYIVDKETNERIAEGKRETLPFLKKHYNLANSANLEEIFTNTIGVPQGQFTAIFLDTATNRKRVFDKVLNLEDYRSAYENLKDFKAYLKDSINEINIQIATYATDVSKIPHVEEEISHLSNDIGEHKEQIKALTVNMTNLKDSLDLFEKLSKEITTQKNNLEKEKLDLSHKQKLYDDNNKLLEESQKAKEVIASLKKSFDKYNELKETISTLDNQKKQYEDLSKELLRKEKDLQNVSNAVNTFNEKIKKIEEIHLQITELEPQCLKQTELEKEKLELRKLKEQFKELETSLKYSQKEVSELDKQLTFIEDEINKINSVKDLAISYENINKQHSNLNAQLTEIQSMLNENKKMADQLKGGLCPFLKEQCKNIAEGQDLESYFKSIIDTLITDQDKTKKEFNNIDSKLKGALEAHDIYKQSSIKENEKNNLLSRINKIKDDISNTEKTINEMVNISDKFNGIVKELESIGSPKDKITILKQQTADETKLINSLTVAAKNMDVCSSAVLEIKEKLNKINFNETEYNELKTSFINLEGSYQSYLKNEASAKNYEHLKILTINLLKEVECKQLLITNLITQIKEQESNYDSTKHTELKISLDTITIEKAKIEETMKHKSKKIDENTDLLKNLLKYKELIGDKEKSIEELLQIDTFINTSREIFKTCGPQIGRFYIENIAIEANNLYQEIANKPNQILNWSLDYEITIEENGHSRSFNYLSGGEQMVAALSIRLSLLNELSDINIAFFDEPTTNMDETRRNNLAQQINSITSFDQLFVISHDDTFEKDIDNVIRLN